MFLAQSIDYAILSFYNFIRTIKINYLIYPYCFQSQQYMSKILKKQGYHLKFDTSQANINCFIRDKPKQKIQQYDSSAYQLKTKKKSRKDRDKQSEFQDKAFLQSVVCKILNDVDCKGINELIDNMVFPTINSSELQANKPLSNDDVQHQQIKKIFQNHQILTKSNNFLPNNKDKDKDKNKDQFYHIQPLNFNNVKEYNECTTTVHSSLNNSFVYNGNQINNDKIRNQNIVIPVDYNYNYYPQENNYYNKYQNNKKRYIISGEEVNQYKLIPEKVQTDGRTTLMIRHIPNKYTQEMLLEEMGKNYKLKVNFLYLPIDQFNTCNVGYAFVNFIHTKFIYDFYKEFNGRKWNYFNSQKICQLAYARIQGTTNLMDHFQNTSGNQLKMKNLSKSIKDISDMLELQKYQSP